MSQQDHNNMEVLFISINAKVYQGHFSHIQR